MKSRAHERELTPQQPILIGSGTLAGLAWPEASDSQRECQHTVNESDRKQNPRSPNLQARVVCARVGLKFGGKTSRASLTDRRRPSTESPTHEPQWVQYEASGRTDTRGHRFDNENDSTGVMFTDGSIGCLFLAASGSRLNCLGGTVGLRLGQRSPAGGAGARPGRATGQGIPGLNR